MKRLFKTLGLVCLILAFAFTGCQRGGGTNSSSDSGKTVAVTALEDSIQIKDSEVAGYDYTKHFKITVNGAETQVLPSYIDSSKVKAEAGIYTVTCSYSGKSDSLAVQVIETVYGLTLSVEEVTVKVSAALSYDYNGLFTATIDNAPVEITDDMITTDLKAEAGDYDYTVTLGTLSETLKVHVVPDHTAEIILTYKELAVPVNDLPTLDVTELFSLYIDGVAVEVTEDMIDASALDSANVGDVVDVTLNYSENGITASGVAKVRIAEAAEIVITARNISTYPNGDEIDLTTLFTIKRGEEVIPVTIDMIEGTIDYSSVGDNEITLTYGGKTATAIVTVRHGVVLGYASSDTIVVRKGTEKTTYPFADDFTVIVNGARYTLIPDSYIDTSAVNFDDEGSYEVTISIPYSNEEVGWGTSNFEYTSLTITYVVSPVVYELSVKSANVVLAAGTKTYNPFNNVTLVKNGINQSLTDNRDYVNAITTYAEITSSIDFNSLEEQTVIIEVYVYGADAEPVEISFTVQINGDITVSAVDKIVFTGATLYARSLFTITEAGNSVPVTDDMLTGKVNTFKAGVYYVDINYRGLTAQSKVVVYDHEMVGTYKTLLTTLPEKEEDDSDDDWGGAEWGDDDGDWYSISANSGIATIAAGDVTRLGDLVIGEDGSISFDGKVVESATGIDEHTIVLSTSRGLTNYTLYYNDGIAMIDVNNNARLAYNDYTRPIIYFQESKWDLVQLFTVNSGSQYVLGNVYSGLYSLDCFRIKDKDSNSEMWYGLYVRLAEYSSADKVYEVKWGEVEFADGFKATAGTSSSLVFDGDTYNFTVTDGATAKIDSNDGNYPYMGTNFNGTIDGKSAQLRATTAGQYVLYVDGKEEMHLYSTDISQMKQGGLMPDDVLFFYSTGGNLGTFSYKFVLDTEGKTFTLAERDLYYGKYMLGEEFIFLSGYGTGSMYVDGRSTELTYTYHSGEITVVFDNLNPTFEYGRSATFYIAPLLNVLTVKSSHNDSLAGRVFENTVITDGAIVSVPSDARYVLSGLTPLNFRKLISIKTKDGEMSDSDKNIDTTCINFGHAGFYQYTITVKVGGKDVVSYYSVQVLGNVYGDENPVVGNYSSGLINSGYSMTLDRYGRATVSLSGKRYDGLVTIYEDNSFAIKAYDENGEFVSGKGTMIAKGFLKVEFDGAIKAADYFVNGSSKQVAAGKGGTFRKVTVGGQDYYILASSLTATGDVVEVTVEGDLYKITGTDGQVRYARVTWGNTTDGFTFVENP